ncbi:hypothetical protein [Brevibacillus agri]|uniref:hypothetical protein n=1 Tax=Brevibacillus agri TaxID=51101 RepID=UPI000471E513|nr:hypothetical protein [Brevibacillus agri]WHX32002.1 hypothetical protein QNK09_07275 [Brevibacillus agri]
MQQLANIILIFSSVITLIFAGRAIIQYKGADDNRKKKLINTFLISLVITGILIALVTMIIIGSA